MTDRTPFSGVIAPVLTPFDARLEIDVERYVEHARWLLEDGCTGLAPFGTTGEALSLGLDERLAALEALIDGGIDPAVLMPGTGLCSIPDTVALTRRAVDLGCGGAMVLPPFYFKGVPDDGIFRHFAEVIERVGDERLRIYLYHIPPQAVIGFSVDLVGRLIDRYPATVVGLKDSSGDWSNTKSLLDAYPGFAVLSGAEVFLLDNVRNGGAGCISASANVNARAIRELYERRDDPEADTLQARVTRFRALTQKMPVIPVLKHIVAHYRDDPTWRTARPPLPRIDAAQADALLREIEAELEFKMELGVAA